MDAFGDHGLTVQNGAVCAWGYNYNGQLGDGTNASSGTLVAVSTLNGGVTQVAAGGASSFAIQNGALFAWGNNSGGQLGIGSNTNSNSHIIVTGLSSGVTAVSVNQNELAIQNGAAYAWGSNVNGGLGNGSFTNSNAPVPVTALSSGVTSIAAGYYHNLAIMNGAVYAWGANNYGQLGAPVITKGSASPIEVPALTSGVTAIAAGEYHSLAIQNGLVYAWGDNSHGELGNGTQDFDPHPSPTLVTGLSSIVAIAAVYDSSYALSSDGTLWAWGDNFYDNLGDGTGFDRYSPVQIHAPLGYRFTGIVAQAVIAMAILAPVPEPSTLAAFGIGALMVLHPRRHRKAV